MSTSLTYAVYEYAREGDLTRLQRQEFEVDQFRGLDTPLKEETVFETKGEIALLFDYNSKCPHESVLLKHGDIDLVEEAWKSYKPLGEAIKKAGQGSLVFLKGQFSVSELNKMLNIAGYVGTWYATIIPVDGRQNLHAMKEQRNQIGLSL